MKVVTIAHLYPGDMNIYGDIGNVIALCRRLEWRGYTPEVVSVEPGVSVAFDRVDIIFGGGGQDSGQSIVASDLKERAGFIHELVEREIPMLVICGMYQLFAREFVTVAGERLEGIGVFNARTLGGDARMIGNINVESPFGVLAGFENHSGETHLGQGQEALGRVTKGFGNNLKSGFEGAVQKNAIGTYLHGPILPKNPALADHIIKMAIHNRYGASGLSELNNSIENAAREVALRRPQ